MQEAIGRVQPFEQLREGVRILREAGLKEISFDLMYGLPASVNGRPCAFDPARRRTEAQRIAPLAMRTCPGSAPSASHRRNCAARRNTSASDQAELAGRMLMISGIRALARPLCARR